MKSHLLMALAPAALCVLGFHTAASAEDGLQAAFHTAFGVDAVRRVIQPADPPSASKDTNLGPPRPVDLKLEPARLVPLGAGRYALIVLETNGLGSHSDPGAIAIAYLRRAGSAWSVDKTWPEFIWTGNNGHPADHTKVLAFAAVPMISVSSDYVGQGEHSASAWVIRLGAQAPKYLGQAPLGGSLEPEECPRRCRHYDFKGRILPPRAAGNVFSVAYTGRQQTHAGTWVKFSERTDYRWSGGELAPTRKLDLPQP